LVGWLVARTHCITLMDSSWTMPARLSTTTHIPSKSLRHYVWRYIWQNISYFFNEQTNTHPRILFRDQGFGKCNQGLICMSWHVFGRRSVPQPAAFLTWSQTVPLTSWSRVLLHKEYSSPSYSRNHVAIFGNRIFITVPTKSHHLSMF
jgi:hypothetical protein